MLLYVRHGETHSNEVGHEKLRGWLPIPLSLQGMEQAEQVARELSTVEGIKKLYCGTLVRVVQTAGEIAEWVGMELSPLEELNDWNTGDFAGQSVQETLDDLHDHIKHPLNKVPGGEPFQFFLDRIIPILRECVESKDLYVVVTSGRVGTLLKALSLNKGEHPDTETLLGKPPIDPAGMMLLDSSWSIVYKTMKDVASKGLS